MREFFAEALKDKQFQTVEHVREVVSWYRQRSKSKDEDVSDSDFFVSKLVNKVLEKLLQYAEPYYEDSVVKRIGIETQFKDGTVETNFKIGLIPIFPFVEFDKIVDGKKVYSIKFQFRLGTETYIDRYRINNDMLKKSIEIEKMGISFGFSLESVEGPGFTFERKIKLKEKQIQVSDISLAF